MQNHSSHSADMARLRPIACVPLMVAGVALLAAMADRAGATEPCGDFGECKALVEINSTDGDAGFHFLADGDDLTKLRIEDPNGAKLFQYHVKGALKDQKLTETFAESSEPPCRMVDAEPGDRFQSLKEFLSNFDEGTYTYYGQGEMGEFSIGETDLSHDLPSAPVDVDFTGGQIVWAHMTPPADLAEKRTSLGRCSEDLDSSDFDELFSTPPWDVEVAQYEAVMEADVEPGEEAKGLNFSIRVPGDVFAVTVPAEYLAALPDDTPVKIEVGAISADDNATFTEEDGFCINVDEGCDD